LAALVGLRVRLRLALPQQGAFGLATFGAHFYTELPVTIGYLFFRVDLFLVDLLEDLLSDHLESKWHVLACLGRDFNVYQVELLREDLGFFL
jgi:ABC-type uncharacterized transport system permease subunit